MSRLKFKNKYIKIIVMSLCLILPLGLGSIIYKLNSKVSEIEAIKIDEDDQIKQQYQLLLQNLFDYRNKAILEQNEEILKELYDTDKKTGLWAYEHEVEKMKYLKNWSSKQGVTFNDIKTKVKIRKVKEKETDLYGIICNVATDYNYSYENEDEIDEVIKEKNIRLVDVEKKLKDIENEIKNRFIGKRTIPVIEEEIKEVESNIEKYETQLKASYVVSEVLTEVYDEIRSSFGPILNSNVITSFKEFTDGKYNEVMVSDNYEMKVKDDKSIMAAEALSNGANDQLYLSLRLAFVEMIFKNKDIPICLDDTFIQYDDKRLERTIKYLIKERFEQYIIFTCQKREEAVIRNNSISHKYIKL